MDVPHTPSTYHRTWETGLGVEIRVATVSPDFSVFPSSGPLPAKLSLSTRTRALAHKPSLSC